MSKVILKQPNGMWAVWCTTTDSFLHEDLTKGQVLDYYAELGREKYLESAYDNMNHYEKHGKSRGIGRTYQECKEWEKEVEQ